MPTHARLRFVPVKWTRVTAEPAATETAVVAAAARETYGGMQAAQTSGPVHVSMVSDTSCSSTSAVLIPELELFVEDMLLIRLSKSLFSGKLLVSAGPGLCYDSQVRTCNR